MLNYSIPLVYLLFLGGKPAACESSGLFCLFTFQLVFYPVEVFVYTFG